MRPLLVRVVRLADRGVIVAAVAAALIVALGVGLSLREGSRLKSMDEPAFLDISENLATHFEFAHTNDPTIEGYEPSLPLGALRPTAYRAPGYVFFLAPFRRLGAGYIGLRIVNFGLLASTLLLAYGFLTTRCSKLAGLLAVLFGIGYPVLVYAAGTLYPQTLSALVLVMSVWLLDRARPESKLATYAWAGLAYGALILTVPVYLLLVPIVVWWLLRIRRSSLRQVGVTLAVIGAAVGVWSLRNMAVFGTPMALGTNSGFNLLSGNCPNAHDGQISLEARWPEYVYTELTGKNEVEQDRILTRAALQSIRDDPTGAGVLYVKKFLFWFSIRNELLSDKVVPGGAGAGERWLRDLIMLSSYGILLGLLLVRLVLWRRFPFAGLELLLLWLYIGGGLAYAIYFTRIRFRLPFDWLLIAMDAIFVSQLFLGWISARPRGSIDPEASSSPA
jgi:hypothetical protein